MIFPKFITRRIHDAILFGYVRGVKKNMPTASVLKIMEQYREEFNFTDEEFNIEAERTKYETMNREYYELEKHERKSKG